MALWFVSAKSTVGYDCYDAHVVSCESAERARQYCAANPGDEGRDLWLDPNLSDCVEILSTEPEGIVLSSYNAG